MAAFSFPQASSLTSYPLFFGITTQFGAGRRSCELDFALIGVRPRRSRSLATRHLSDAQPCGTSEAFPLNFKIRTVHPDNLRF